MKVYAVRVFCIKVNGQVDWRRHEDVLFSTYEKAKVFRAKVDTELYYTYDVDEIDIDDMEIAEKYYKEV